MVLSFGAFKMKSKIQLKHVVGAKIHAPPPHHHHHTNTPGPITFCQYSHSAMPASFASMHQYYCNAAHQHSHSATTWERLIRDASAWRTKTRRSRISVIVSHITKSSEMRGWAPSPINIYGRRATSNHVTYLISGWAPMPLIWDSH
jgi:hypothetical protein